MSNIPSASPSHGSPASRAHRLANRVSTQSRWIWLLAGFILYATFSAVKQPLQAKNPISNAASQITPDCNTTAAQQGNQTKPAVLDGITGYSYDIKSTLENVSVGNTTAFGSWGEDFVAAFPSAAHRSALIRGSRAWRKGMRTCVSMDIQNTHALTNLPSAVTNREKYMFYPNDQPRRSFYEGDSRAALAPFLAYNHFGPSFKWMLYGDDDTVFFQRGVKRLVAQLDPEMPYFITDHLWFTYPGYGAHPADEAPRCLPCGWQGPTTHVREDYVTHAYTAPIGCPCRPELLCNEATLQNDPKGIWRGNCKLAPVYSFPQQLYSMHGGAGAILSVGLLKRVNYTQMEACVLSKSSTGGDSFITECLWEQGFATTDPGFSFANPRVRIFDPTDGRTTQLMMALYDAAHGSKQCPRCKAHLEHLVTMHVASRGFHAFDDASMYIEMVTDLYDELGSRSMKGTSAEGISSSGVKAGTARKTLQN